MEVSISTYPLLSDELLDSTMFPVMMTSPLNLLLHAVQLPASHIANLDVAGHHLVAVKMKKVSTVDIPSTYSIAPPQNPHGFCTTTTLQVYL